MILALIVPGFDISLFSAGYMTQGMTLKLNPREFETKFEYSLWK
jgi:hypothetical protein